MRLHQLALQDPDKALSRRDRWYVDMDFVSARHRHRKMRTSRPDALPGWSYSRTGIAYADNQSGNLIQFPTGTPRITDNGYLSESQSTNILLQSEDFSSGSWSKGNSSITVDQATAPNGQQTADLLSITTNGGFFFQGFTGVVSQTYTFSVYVRPGSTNWCRIFIYDPSAPGGSAQAGSYFNVSTGAIGSTVSNGTGYTLLGRKIKKAANGFWRVSLTVTVGTTSCRCWVTPCSGDAGSEIAGNTCYVWGAQCENRFQPTSYIPTTTATATRSVDNGVLSGLLVVAPFTVVFVVDHNDFTSGQGSQSPGTVSVGGSGSQNYVFPFRSGVGLPTIQGVSGNTNVYNLNSGVAVTTDSIVRYAVSHDGDSWRAVANGVPLATTQAAAPIGVMDRVSIGQNFNGAILLDGWVREVLVANRAMMGGELLAA